jgi:hypothetical protein
MPDKIIQAFDEHDNQTLADDLGPVLATKAVEAFLLKHGDEWDRFATDSNFDLLVGYCTGHVVPITLRNLRIAMLALIEDGTISEREDMPTDVELVVQEFTRRCPDWVDYRNQKNSDALDNYLSNRQSPLPVTVDNLISAFKALVQSHKILPAQTGFGNATFKSKLNMADQQLRSEETAKARELAKGPATDSRNTVRRGISEALTRSYHQSRIKRHEEQGPSPRELRDARHKISNANPDIDIRSSDFSRLVNEEVIRSREN